MRSAAWDALICSNRSSVTWENGDSTSKDPKQILLSVKNIGPMEKRVSHAKVMGELVRMGVVEALPSSPATLVMKTAKVDEGDKKPVAVIP